MTKFPWVQLMQLGLHERGLSPKEFWASTLRELLPVPGAVGLSRDCLNVLIKQWPDEHITTGT